MRRALAIALPAALIACVQTTHVVRRRATGADPAGGAPESRLDPVRRNQLLRRMPAVDDYLDRKVVEHGFPTLVAGIVAGGELVWWRGYGGADADTVYRIGSITKAFTGAAVLKLRDDGALDLDDPAERWLPQLARLAYPTDDSPRITIRHLLTHTSGIGGDTNIDYWRRPNHPLTEKELFAALDGFRLEQVPGTETDYSNIGMGLAGLIAGRAGKLRYRDYVTRELLGPLGMIHTVWRREDVPADRLAPGYRRVDGERVQEHHWRLGAVAGMGGAYSSLRDMWRFVAWQLSAWPPRDGANRGPVARASVRESHMLGAAMPPDSDGWGIGWRVRDDEELGHLVSHVGGTFQYAAAVFMLPHRDLGVVLLCNDGYGLDKVGPIARQVLWITTVRVPQ